ncbi:hypothetical protein SISNIDRAFT_486268 [Sistotremastrum niveocremeum HHB9708]|uniref:Uncharacterized protein n=1 Tax=Sistotremastrum niveocremeum HHB9708 TaxID=1314777 RepID=A0A164TZ44_9AGAM|nr:hypothetical protein SISNIDRAFT_486268 [Sistotremastrum niveocremeum HHB9708]
MSGRTNCVRQEAKLVETEIDPGGLSPNPPNLTRVDDNSIVLHHVAVPRSGRLGDAAIPTILSPSTDDIANASDSDDGSAFPRTDTLESTEDNPTFVVPVTVSVGLKIDHLKAIDAIHVISVSHLYSTVICGLRTLTVQQILVHGFIYCLTPSELLHANDWPLWKTIMAVGPLISASGALIKAFTVVPFFDSARTDHIEKHYGGIVGVNVMSRLPSICFLKGVHYLASFLLALGPVVSQAGLILAYGGPLSLTLGLSGAFLAIIVVGTSGVVFKTCELGHIIPKLTLYKHHRSANKSRRGIYLPEGGNER